MKSQRHFKIMDIISSERVATQEELCEVLKRNNYNVSQATVSRDIKEMQLLRLPDAEGYRYVLPENNTGISQHRIKRVFKDSVMTLDFSENLIVIKTLPGTAHSVASLIDFSEQAHILGTVAGDDTIFVAVKPKKAVKGVMKYFENLLSE